MLSSARHIASLLVAGALLCIPLCAGAGELDGALGGLSWGDDPKAVCTALEQVIMDEAEAAIATQADPRRQDAIRKAAEDEVAELRASFFRLKDRTRYGASIVGDEFLEANAEAVLVDRDTKATRYFFFHDDALYKLAVSYDPRYLGDVDFGAFVGASAAKYGNDFSQTVDADGYLAQVAWEADGSRLRVVDETPTYDTVLMVFADASKDDVLGPAQRAASDARSAGPDASEAIADATTGTDASDGSAIDGIIGETDVDLGHPDAAVTGSGSDTVAVTTGESSKGTETEKPTGKRVKVDPKKGKIDPDDLKTEEVLEGGDGPIYIY